MRINNPYVAICCALLLSACTTQKALKETKRQYDNGDYGWAIYTGTMGVAMAAVVDVFTLGGTSDVNEGTSTLSSAASAVSPGSDASRTLSAMASSSRLQSDLASSSSTPQMAQAALENATEGSEKLSSFSAEQYMKKGGECAKDLSYLNDQLPLYSPPETTQIRNVVLKTTLDEVIAGIKKSGITTDKAIEQSLLQAQENEKIESQALQTAAQSDGQGITENQFSTQVKTGKLQLSACDGIRNSALCEAVNNSYGALANRAIAANLMCYKKKNLI